MTEEQATTLSQKIEATYHIHTNVTGRPDLPDSFVVGIFMDNRCVCACDSEKSFESLRAICYLITGVDNSIREQEQMERRYQDAMTNRYAL